jgi:hypothetical protein
VLVPKADGSSRGESEVLTRYEAMSWLSAIKTRVVVGYEIENRRCDMDMEVEVEVGDRWPIDVESGDDDSVTGEMARWQ